MDLTNETLLLNGDDTPALFPGKTQAPRHGMIGTHWNTGLNQRRFPRFKPQNDMYVFHHDFGKVVEIGMGGMVFKYLEKDTNTMDPPTGILFDYQDQCIDGLPFETLSDHVLCHFPSNSHNIRQRRIRFGNLTARQLDQLENFILANARIPQLTHDARYETHRSNHLPAWLYTLSMPSHGKSSPNEARKQK